MTVGQSDPRPRPLHSAETYPFPHDPERMLSWTHVETRLEAAQHYWLATTGSTRPHVTPVWGVWIDRALYMDGHPHSHWARNIARNPRVTVHLESAEDVTIVEGDVEDINTEEALGQRIVQAWMAKYGRLAPEPVSSGLFRLRPARARGWSTSNLGDGAAFDFLD